MRIGSTNKSACPKEFIEIKMILQEDNQQHQFLSCPLPSNSEDVPTSTAAERETILDGNGFILKNLLSRDECQHFINQADGLHMERLDPNKGSFARKADRVEVRSKDVASWLYDRIHPYLKDVETVPNRRIEKGKWQATGLNDEIRLIRYSTNDFFLPHHDGYVQKTKYYQSLMTVMVYLNEDFDGGETRFFDESQRHYEAASLSKLKYSYKPRMGDAMIFYSQHTHDGSELIRGKKYILRTEIMFQLREEDRPKFESDYDDTIEFGPDVIEYRNTINIFE